MASPRVLTTSNGTSPGGPARSSDEIAIVLLGAGGAQDVRNASISDPNKVVPLKGFAYAANGATLTFMQGVGRIVPPYIASALRALTGYVS